VKQTEWETIVDQGVGSWNRWRSQHPQTLPDLSDSHLDSQDLTGINLSNSNLRKANLLSANLYLADLSKADLSGADLQAVDFRNADLGGANLTGTYLGGAIFNNANLENTDFTGAFFNLTTFGDNDLSVAKGLNAVTHGGPSFIGVHTIYRSRANISKIFLRNCGLPDEFIVFAESLVNAPQPIQSYSCFISHSTKDAEFVRQLHSKLQFSGLSVWYSEQDLKAGHKVEEQIDRAIRVYDKLLLVISANSMRSEWVKTEIRKARKIEVNEKKQKLFPIALVSFDDVKEWEFFDSDLGQDLASELRQYYILDFSKWQEPDAFDVTVERLLNDLTTEPAK
jgi:hypothetical protein